MTRRERILRSIIRHKGNCRHIESCSACPLHGYSSDSCQDDDKDLEIAQQLFDEEFAKKPDGGIKHDDGKIQLELLSSRWLFGVGSVLTFGARKYAAHNWRKGIAISRLLGAALRHTVAFLGGEDKDPETGISHLYHASCCLMFAAETMETKPHLDDRYKEGESK